MLTDRVPYEDAAVPNAWREAIIEKLVIWGIYTGEHESDPQKAINDLLNMEVSVALDPQVSRDASALVEAGRTLALAGLKSSSIREDSGTRVAVSPALFWKYPQVEPPRYGVKYFLLGEGGVAITPGEFRRNDGIIAYHPLFKRDHVLEQRLGIACHERRQPAP